MRSRRYQTPFFGDLHIHTRYSFDSYLSNQKNDPDGAYEYATGQVITLPDAYGDQTLSAQIDRPIDFAAVTDHGQFLGEVALCDSDWTEPGWWAPVCIMSRTQTYGSSFTQRAYGPYQAAWRAKRLSEAWSALLAIARRTLCPPGTTFRPRQSGITIARGLQLHHLCRLRVHAGGDGESAQECHLQRGTGDTPTDSSLKPIALSPNYGANSDPNASKPMATVMSWPSLTTPIWAAD